MGNLRRRFGFWASLGQFRVREFLSPEISLGVLLGSVGAYLLVRFTSPNHRLSVAGDYLTITAALLGIVFAGLALVVGLISDTYLDWLNSTNTGVFAFLSPFMFTIGLHVGAVMLSIFYRAAAKDLPQEWEWWIFGVTSVLFVTAVLQVVALTRSVLMHGVARARSARMRDLDAE